MQLPLIISPETHLKASSSYECWPFRAVLKRAVKYLLLLVAVTNFVLLLPNAPSTAGDPGVYEVGSDPSVGFNLISWANFGGGGASTWENAVQSIYDAGFSEVSISPVRYITLGTGSIATSSSQGPELAHIAAGISRAKSLGMRVTVNPFVEPAGFSTWRGFYNPSPGSAESNTFWNDYEQYLVDVAQIAQANGADAMTVGTELKAITQNSGNNAKWNSVISAVDAQFGGSLGYAANWDNYQDANLTSTIWENSAIDFLGIDSYFQGMLSNSQADNSGSYPNPTFINQVETAWNDKLDNEIIPFAAARQSGGGLPVEFVEIGYLPYNRTTVSPQNTSGAIDQDEQNMAYEGLMRALDGRQATGELTSVNLWNWGMPGTGNNLWDMGVSGTQPHANNIQTTQWLSDFVSNPGTPPTSGTQVLYSFESGDDGFFYPNFEAEPASILAQVGSLGATNGSSSLAITKPTPAWTWDARVDMSGEQLLALQEALNDDIDNYVLEIDVTYVSSDLPGSLTSLGMHLTFESNLDGWSQDSPFASISSPTDQTIRVEVPLSSFTLTAGLSSANFTIGFSGSWLGADDVILYLDRIALRDTTFTAPEDADFDNDGDIDGQDFLSWQRGFGISSNADTTQGDANGDGAVSESDFTIWQSQYGTPSALSAATAIPEPSTAWLAVIAGLVLYNRNMLR